MSSFDEQIVEESFMNSLSRYARKLTSNIDEAQDLVQQTYEKILTRRDQFSGNHVLPWAITIMQNSFKDSFKKIKEHQFVDEVDPDVSDNSDHEENLITDENESRIKSIVHQCMQKLSNENRELITYREEGFSYAEISEFLQLSVANLRVKLLRAKDSMRLCLEGAVA